MLRYFNAFADRAIMLVDRKWKNLPYGLPGGRLAKLALLPFVS